MNAHNKTTAWRSFQGAMLTLLVALACWIGNTVQQSAVEIAKLQVQILDMQQNVADVPALQTRVTTLEAKITNDEKVLDNLNNVRTDPKLRSWQR